MEPASRNHGAAASAVGGRGCGGILLEQYRCRQARVTSFEGILGLFEGRIVGFGVEQQLLKGRIINGCILGNNSRRR